MIGYVTLGTNNYDAAAKFYDELLAVIGASRFMESDRFIAWAVSPTQPSLGIIKPFDGQAATVGNGTMVSLIVNSRDKVDAVHAKALALGGKDEGPAGPRGDSGFYAGYFRDLDGNKLNVFCMA
ncbi:VOC family protein [Undibacterium sp. LX40W]|uniref:VOC family protein n=1 Tax=Undibacterium nitidum TaxID=2762298 RepID=A0A923HSC4_9BURK|nr:MULTISPECIES: VOC family protein [Undibacterium]MBC3883088.1 VOC family protein [Undibacterium nitidum]MBC3893369.1 VOC family protein [Undibacterium sp. LX40W]